MIARSRHQDVYGCYFEHSIVVLDYRTGAVRALHGSGIASILASTSPDDGRNIPVEMETHVMRVLRREVGAVQRGLRLSPGRTTGLSFGAEEHEAGLTAPAGDIDASKPATVTAVIALCLVLAAKVLGRRTRAMRRLVSLAAWTASLPSKLATTEDAEHQVRAVRQLATRFPARVACLEESIAATVALALRGRSVTWCHGVAADPFNFHAWVKTDTAVAEPASTSRYTILRTIPETPTRKEKR